MGKIKDIPLGAFLAVFCTTDRIALYDTDCNLLLEGNTETVDFSEYKDNIIESVAIDDGILLLGIITD